MSDSSNPFADFSKMMENLKLPGIDVGKMVESGRKDMEALVEANKAAYEGLQALAHKQKEMLADAMHNVQEAARRAGERTGGAHATEMAQEVYQKALADMRELANIVRSSQAEALTRVADRAIEHLQELKHLLQPK